MIITTRELYDRAAAAADMHDQFVTPKQFCYWLSQEILALTLFAARLGWTQNVKTTSFTVTGAEAGAFPLTGITPLCVVAIHQVRDQLCRPLKYTNAVDFLRQIPGSGRITGDPAEYRVMWDEDANQYVVNFYPEPPAGTSFLVSYIPTPKRATLDVSPAAGYANSYNLPPGWEELPVNKCARRALKKEDPESNPLGPEISSSETLVEESVYDFVRSLHPTVRKVDTYSSGWADKLIYPAPSFWNWF